MNIRLLLIIFLGLLSNISNAQVLISNPITDVNPNAFNPYTGGQTTAANITFNGIGRGTGANGAASNDRYNANSWNTASIDLTAYFEFSFVPSTGFEIDFTNFVYVSQASATGPTQFAIRSSVDNFTSDIALPSVAGGTISLSSPAFQNIAAPITFRLYAWGTTSSTGTFSVNSFSFSGGVNIAACTPAIVSTIWPVEGPAKTEVTITSSSDLTGAAAILNGEAMDIVSTSATKLVVSVPEDAATGTLTLVLANGCPSAHAFTIISSDNAGCDTGTSANPPTHLVITEVTDATLGSSSYIEIFNGTSSAINLANYSLKFYNNGNTTTLSATVALSGTIASGGIYVVSIGTTTCSAFTGTVNASSAGLGGINFNTNSSDFIGLYNNATLVDAFGVFGSATWANGLGYGDNGINFRRSYSAAVWPSTSFSLTDWEVVDWTSCGDSDYSNLGVYAYVLTLPPIVSVQPVFTNTCSPNVTFTTIGTEAIDGGQSLGYQWYQLAPNALTWSLMTGETASTVSTSAANIGYQYYARVRESGATCYTASVAVIVRDRSTTWNGTAWSNGVPDATKPVVINANYSTLASGSFECCTLTINAGKKLAVTPNMYVKVDGAVTNNGTFEIADSGSLVQVTDVVNATANMNIGTIQMMRNAKPMYRYDYTYWSSPVTTDSDFTLNDLSPVTKPDKYFRWDGAVQDWVVINNGAAVMAPGQGYIIRAPQNFPTNPGLTMDFSPVFTGRPNNGTVTVPIVGSASPDAAQFKYNLLGNPYPSAVDAVEFVTANANLGGTLYFWTHNTAISSVPDAQGIYQYNSADYATYNISGGTGTGTAASTGLPAEKPDGRIAAGQGFFVRGVTSGSSTATFNNAMRAATGNNQFYKQAETQKAAGTALERHRIWLNLTDQLGHFSQNLTAYVDGATNGIDRLYDGELLGSNPLSLYSVADAVKLKIQGRMVPFVVDDVVPIGYKSTTAGELTIAVDAVDGLFTTQNIYIEDLLLNVVHDIKQSPYHFSSDAGTFDSRLLLRYTNETLGNDTFESAKNDLIIAAKDSSINLLSSINTISEVIVYDLVGRIIFEKHDIIAKSFAIENVVLNKQALIVKVKLQDGQIITKKIIL